jgi:hypothetical protein
MNYQFFEIKPNLASIKIIFDNFAFFSITPFLKGKINIFTFIIFLEILIIISYLFIRIKEEKKIYLNILLKWSIILFLSYLFYSIFIFNDGTIIRYKVPIFFFIIFGYFANIKNLKSK